MPPVSPGSAAYVCGLRANTVECVIHSLLVIFWAIFSTKECSDASV